MRELSEIKEITKKICDALDSKKAYDLKIIDISNVSVIADYFVVATADNINQLHAMQNEVENIMAKDDIRPISIEGNSASTWVLLDYEDVIVHLFSEEDRLFYNLEKIWQDGIVINPEEF